MGLRRPGARLLGRLLDDRGALDAIGHRAAFGPNWDPSHFVWQDIDPVGFLRDFRDRIHHVHCKDARRQLGNGRNGRLASHLAWADPRRGWDFVSAGRGDVPWEAAFRMLNAIGYAGPLSVEWEDAGMDRIHPTSSTATIAGCPRGHRADHVADRANDVAARGRGVDELVRGASTAARW